VLGGGVRNVLELRPASIDRPATVLRHGAAEVAVFDAAGTGSSWVVVPQGPQVRLAVLDGDARATDVTRTSLRTDDDIEACVWQASKMLHGCAAPAVVADVRIRWDDDACARVVRVDSGAAFARFGDRWSTLFSPAVGANEPVVESTGIEAFDELVLASDATVLCWRRADEIAR
jgi:hypothetical protein